ncbi:RHS repeat protein [Streptomyces sp. A1277]|uniref:putative T7SS-secreted protein n=1 Tax=Streptomyces sp. A1277 TaxID=2563103 RepID=UPI0010A2A588|nr:RHS repeat-associated core domain-containing protein [Streptomyces sp. A1277]THA36505.1 RHS repeat protein [Streptomyces sp. A1277]
MGLGDLVSDLTPDVIEDAVEDGTKWVGDRVEDAGDWTADRLEDVGWDSGADWVREQSRSVANRMGAEVEEMDLGQTEDKKKLVYGSPSEIRSTATHLKNLQSSLDKVGGGLKGLDASELKGKTADAFRESVSVEPPQWFQAADAFEKAAGALESFAGTVEWAQGQAQLAIDKWKAGTKASEEAMDAHKEKCDTFNKAVDTYNALPADKRDPSTLPPRPGAFTDPGKARMEEAQQLLAEARTQRNTAAETARAAVAAARDAAPKKPKYADQVADGLAETQIMNTHFVGGVAKGTAGLLNFVRTVNPMDPYNVTHPAEYGLALNNTAAGLVQVANDPWGAGKQMVTEFMKDPAEGLGRLVPDLVLTAATGGGGAAVKGARTAKELADLAQDANKARRLIDDAPEGTHNRTDLERTTKGTDPVDLASGRMFLPQTDIVLPGVLPLAFTRRVESGYTAGRFFGPSWSSTVDEHLEIDANGVIHVTDDGRLITYPHPAPGLATRPETGTSRSILERDASGDYRLTDPDTGITRHFDAPPGTDPGEDGAAWLGEISDRNNNTITFDRTDDGIPLAVIHSAGYHLALTTVGARVTGMSLLDKAGAAFPVRSYGYTDGNLTTITKPSGATLTFEYDDRRRLTVWIDSNNRRYDYTYDDRDRVITEGGEHGHLQVAIDYSEPEPATGHRFTTLANAQGHATRYRIDGRCRIVSSTDPLGHTTRFTYDKHGNLTSCTDPLGRTTAFVHDHSGRLTTVVRPDGSKLRSERDAAGHRSTYTLADGTRWQQEFDERGNRVALTGPSGHTMRYSYDDHGRYVSVTNALGAITEVECDAAGSPLRITDPLGAPTCFQLDAFGRPVRIEEPLGAVTKFEWTADGELARRTGPGGVVESWSYDGEGNRLTHTDPIGGTSYFEYTHFDLLSARTGPDGARHEFVHNTDLQLTEVVNPQGLTWSYAYDPAGRLIAEKDFDGRIVSYDVDPAGQVCSRTNLLGGRVDYEHDQLGHVIRKNVAGEITTYAYDRAGRLTRATAPDSELIYQYDRAGRVKTEMVDGRIMAYAYDALGRRSRRITPTGQVTSYGYDDANRLIHLTTGSQRIAFDYDANGREQKRAYGEMLTLTPSFDEAGRLCAEHFSNAARTLINRTYNYRPDGHLLCLEDTTRGARAFELDAAGQVTAVTAADWKEAYAYDSAGNQTAASWPASPDGAAIGPRVYEGTTIARAGNTRYEHDTLGRITLRQRTRLSRKPDTWRYTWDTEDRLTEVITPDGTLWRYAYDALGRRTRKQRLGADRRTVLEETRFTWDGSTLCEQTTTSADLPNTVALTWDHHGVRPLAQSERILAGDTAQSIIDQRYFAIVTDLVGSPTELVDESGELAWRTRTSLWGATAWARNSTTHTPLRFPGQYHDPETGLHYNVHRHYDPETARYLTPDPLGLQPSPNAVAYVPNPHQWCDPLGLAPYEPLREGYTSSPGFKKDPYHPDVVESRIEANRELYGVKDPDAKGMIGANGTQITSKTLWNHGPYRIDVENPDPGGRAGQLHFQDQSNKGAKYQYDFETGKFEGLPRSIEKAVGSSPGFIAGIRKGLAALGEG